MDRDRELLRIRCEIETLLLLDRGYWGANTHQRYCVLIDRETTLLPDRQLACNASGVDDHR